MKNVTIYPSLRERLRILPAEIINKWLDGKPKGEASHPFILNVLYTLVYVLSAASVMNISSRARLHHDDWTSYLFGAGFALVVPATVFIAAHFKGLTGTQRVYAWIVAVFAASISMLIQVKVYASGADMSMAMLLSGNVDLEALAFSAGIPFFEVLMASLAAIVSGAHENHLRSVAEAKAQAEAQAQAAAEAKAKAEALALAKAAAEAKALADAAALAEEERVERAHARAMEHARLEAELSNQQAAAALALKLQEAAELAAIEIDNQAKMIDAQSKAQARLARAGKLSGSERKDRSPAVEGDGERPETVRAERSPNGNSNGKDKRFERRVKVLDVFEEHGELSLGEAAKLVGAAKTTVSDDLDWLAGVEAIYRKVNPETGKTAVTVNGGAAAFRAGQF